MPSRVPLRACTVAAAAAALALAMRLDDGVERALCGVCLVAQGVLLVLLAQRRTYVGVAVAVHALCIAAVVYGSLFGSKTLACACALAIALILLTRACFGRCIFNDVESRHATPKSASTDAVFAAFAAAAMARTACGATMADARWRGLLLAAVYVAAYAVLCGVNRDDRA